MIIYIIEVNIGVVVKCLTDTVRVLRVQVPECQSQQ